MYSHIAGLTLSAFALSEQIHNIKVKMNFITYSSIIIAVPKATSITMESAELDST
tara:strand:+ start:207 stop:371 length:165 start_codon:yes stop_codon:yes gene_type:complete